MRRSSIFGAVVLASMTAAILAPCRAQQAATNGTASCELADIGPIKVASVSDGRTFVGEDRREVRLFGIEVPDAEDGKAALGALIGGQTVMLRRPKAGQWTELDRYGRLVADVALGETPVARAMIAGGHAVVAARAGPKPCADMLFAAEREARTARRGLWANPELWPKSAANVGDIIAHKGRYLLVEGDIRSVREFGGTIYLNFGRRYTRDFSVIVARRDERIFAASGIVLKQLEGKRIRVRGFVEMRNGPAIEASRPEQIELMP